jgi:hypothetical protein
MSTHIANIKVTSKDIIKNWWKLNYFDNGQEPTLGFGLLYKAQVINNPLFAIPGWRTPEGFELSGILALVNTNTQLLFPKVAGHRTPTGDFIAEENHFFLWSGEMETVGEANYNVEIDIPAGGSSEAHDYDYGFPVRLMKIDGVDPGSVADIDGNIYETIKIGTYVLLKQNYRVTRFSDGSPIQYLPEAIDWQTDVRGAYCYFNNDPNTV